MPLTFPTLHMLKKMLKKNKKNWMDNWHVWKRALRDHMVHTHGGDLLLLLKPKQHTDFHILRRGKKTRSESVHLVSEFMESTVLPNNCSPLSCVCGSGLWSQAVFPLLQPHSTSCTRIKPLSEEYQSRFCSSHCWDLNPAICSLPGKEIVTLLV